MIDTLDTVFLPGLVCDDAVFAPQLRALAHRAHAAAVADYGDLDSLPDMATSVVAGAPSRFVLVGHSMGGRVALEVVRRWPDRVQALALMDTGYLPLPAGEVGDGERVQRMDLVQLAREQGMRAMGARWVQGMVHPRRLGDRVLLDAILDMIERRTLSQYEAQIRALLARPDASGLLPRVTCPVLVLCGREDSWSPVPQHEDMARLLPRSRLEIVEDCGHMSTMEQPAAVSGLLEHWMESLGPA